VIQKVPDIINQNSEIVFVCESPHIDELYHNYPLAGKSGREMSKFLLGRYDLPLGYVAKTQVLHTELSLKLFSVVNVSELPMQKSAYDVNDQLPPENITLLSKLRKVKRLEVKHKDEELINLRESLYLEFKNKCNKFSNNPLFVPCGNFARAFCLRLNDEIGGLRIVNGIPHPAFGNWRKLTEQQLRVISIKS